MDREIANFHELLVKGPDFETCSQKVALFFEKNMLVRYDRIRVDEQDSVPAHSKEFHARLDAVMTENRQAIKDIVASLKDEGFADLEKWHRMGQGYVSNTVHTLAHLLDGFFGIDSRFYNLIDDSHLVSEQLSQKIDNNPQLYWLIKIEGNSERPDVDRIPFLRKQG